MSLSVRSCGLVDQEGSLSMDRSYSVCEGQKHHTYITSVYHEITDGQPFDLRPPVGVLLLRGPFFCLVVEI